MICCVELLCLPVWSLADDLTNPADVAAFCTQSYGAIQSLKVLCTANYNYVGPDAGQSATTTAQIEFRRPDSIRIDGTDQNDLPYSCVGQGDEGAWKDTLGWHKVKTPKDAVWGVVSKEHGAATTLGNLLLQTEFWQPFTNGKFAKNVGSDVIAGRKTYRIAYIDSRVVTTYWIDKKSGLIVKEREEDQMSMVYHSTTVRVYDYQSVNGKINDSVFAAPN